MRKLLFVINPISGGLDKNGFRKQISEACGKHGLEFTYFETTGEDDLQKLSKKIASYSPSGVIACGGDGTVNMVAKALIDSQGINLGIIPMGSANGLATELELPEDIEQALKVITKGKTRQLDVVKLNDKHLCLHLSDMGLNAKLIRRFEKGTQRGKLGYARHFFETLFKKKPKQYHFKLNNQSFYRKAEMVVFANARKYGTGAIVNPTGKLDDGQFEVCIFKPYPWYALARLTFLFFTGRLNYSPFVEIISTNQVEVKVKPSEYLQIDGELMGKEKKVVAKTGEKQLSVFG